MKIICVTGAASGLGKTSLAVALLERLDGWAACKLTACAEGSAHRCPRGRGDTCGVCGSLQGPYEIEAESEGRSNRSKDTGRLLAAGARKVLWVKARPSHLAPALGEALSRLSDCSGVVVEGNHALEVLDPDVAVMVMSGDGRMKRSARSVRDKVDVFVSGDHLAEGVGEVLRILARGGGDGHEAGRTIGGAGRAAGS